MGDEVRKRLPRWMKMQRAAGDSYIRIKKLVDKNNLHTICTSGKCPNIGECWNAGHATFMILGNICTRSCKFCGTLSGRPLPPNPEEPERLAKTIKLLHLKHCVITSVDRDDLPDGGAAFWASTLNKIKETNQETTFEALIPDFQGCEDCLDLIINTGIEIISHNIETVRRLTPQIRSGARYDRSLGVLRYIVSKAATSKSGIMLGLGENHDEILETLDDIMATGCRILSIGQYLQPGPRHFEVKEYLSPEKFDEYKEIALKKGFEFVESGPLVRTSYNSHKLIDYLNTR